MYFYQNPITATPSIHWYNRAFRYVEFFNSPWQHARDNLFIISPLFKERGDFLHAGKVFLIRGELKPKLCTSTKTK